MGDLIFTIAYGSGLILIGLFSKYMIHRTSQKKDLSKEERVKELL